MLLVLFALFQRFFDFMFLFAYSILINTLVLVFFKCSLIGCGERVHICKFSACAIYCDTDNPNRLEKGVLPLKWCSRHCTSDGSIITVEELFVSN